MTATWITVAAAALAVSFPTENADGSFPGAGLNRAALDGMAVDRVLVKCGPPADDLINGTYVLVGRKGNGLVAQVTEYRKGQTKRRKFEVQQAHCPCPKAYKGKNLRLQISDLSMSWLTQGPRRSNYLATLEYKPKTSPKRKTLGVSCSIL
ncbi:MAG TPA: hypothetical protein VFV50_14835 [Bdellovibrionales bacterium]|nr:hypothetical protein [Bdellovibrionales bacterium]